MILLFILIAVMVGSLVFIVCTVFSEEKPVVSSKTRRAKRAGLFGRRNYSTLYPDTSSPAFPDTNSPSFPDSNSPPPAAEPWSGGGGEFGGAGASGHWDSGSSSSDSSNSVDSSSTCDSGSSGGDSGGSCGGGE